MSQPSLNIPNLDRLISYLEVLPPEEFNMRYPVKRHRRYVTACCLGGHIDVIIANCGVGEAGAWADFLGIGYPAANILFTPPLWSNETHSNKAYPLSRALRMLRHLRAEFIRTGTVVVDWDAPEAVETPRKPWAPPVVIGGDKELPSSLPSLLHEPEAVAFSTSTEA